MKTNFKNAIFLVALILSATITSCKKEDLSVDLTCTVTSTNVTTNGGQDGTITITVLTGNGDYIYSINTTTSNLTGVFTQLTAGVYHVKVEDAEGKTFLKDVTLTEPATIPTLTTTAVSSITSTLATSGGTITSNGGATITVSGICWSTSTNPSITDSKTTDGNTSSFTSNMTNLTPNTTYHVRAYATNSAGTAYGTEVSFTTPPTIPTLTTTAVSSITSTLATSGGTITSNGGATITVSGICWSTSTHPSITDSKTTDGNTSSFTSNMTNLTPNTTYHVRAYATNIAGTGYGEDVIFTTYLAIGDYYQGGIVFYLNGTGGGLISAQNDLTSAKWVNNDFLTVLTNVIIGAGFSNTTNIVTVQGVGNYAAKICYDLVLNEYSDWYLPSRDELNELWKEKNRVGNFTNNDYWSSSLAGGNNTAWKQNFSTGNQVLYNTNTSCAVRAIRSF